MNEESLTAKNEHILMKVSKNSILVNIVLAIGKVAAGVISRSGAMVSDGIHSASDVFSTLVVIIGYKFSVKGADKRHPYGHERIECVTAVILAMILCATGLAIGYSGVEAILNRNPALLPVPGVLALSAAVISILVKELMYHYTKNAARKINSSALMSDAWHHRSDALSSVGSMIGILGARLGYPICDPLAAVVICVLIVKAAYSIFKDGVNKMIDTACDDEIVEKMSATILKQEGVERIDLLNTRIFGARIYVDVEITVNGELTLRQSHTIAENVHAAIEKEFETVKHCMVHVNPTEA